jgi:hypothetical protein
MIWLFEVSRPGSRPPRHRPRGSAWHRLGRRLWPAGTRSRGRPGGAFPEAPSCGPPGRSRDWASRARSAFPAHSADGGRRRPGPWASEARPSQLPQPGVPPDPPSRSHSPPGTDAGSVDTSRSPFLSPVHACASDVLQQVASRIILARGRLSTRSCRTGMAPSLGDQLRFSCRARPRPRFSFLWFLRFPSRSLGTRKQPRGSLRTGPREGSQGKLRTRHQGATGHRGHSTFKTWPQRHAGQAGLSRSSRRGVGGGSPPPHPRRWGTWRLASGPPASPQDCRGGSFGALGRVAGWAGVTFRGHPSHTSDTDRNRAHPTEAYLLPSATSRAAPAEPKASGGHTRHRARRGMAKYASVG